MEQFPRGECVWAVQTAIACGFAFEPILDEHGNLHELDEAEKESTLELYNKLITLDYDPVLVPIYRGEMHRALRRMRAIDQCENMHRVINGMSIIGLNEDDAALYRALISILTMFGSWSQGHLFGFYDDENDENVHVIQE
ncbi:MAG: hypothetical protein AAB071_03165 [Bacteroidota bacterium]